MSKNIGMRGMALQLSACSEKGVSCESPADASSVCVAARLRPSGESFPFTLSLPGPLRLPSSLIPPVIKSRAN